MTEDRIGYRYARSIFDLAVEKGITEDVYTDMQMMQSVCANSRDLQIFLHSPVIAKDRKQKALFQILDGAFKSPLSPLLIEIILRKNREMYLPQIATAFVELYDRKNAIERGVLTTAEKLDEKSLAEIKSIIEKKFTKSFIFEEKIDPSIIGGFILTVGDKRFDGSVAGYLRQYENAFHDDSYVRKY